jgi:CheY-like chemotaxis protein
MAYALVVDDNKEIAEFVGIVLQDASFAVDIIHNGDEALNHLGHHVPDLVVLDLNVPGVNGLDILRYIRQDTDLADVKVIVVSANPQMADQADEADLVLLKPISYQQLYDLVQRFV